MGARVRLLKEEEEKMIVFIGLSIDHLLTSIIIIDTFAVCRCHRRVEVIVSLEI